MLHLGTHNGDFATEASGDTGNTLSPRGRNCGKSATDSVLRADAAREKAKMREIVDASAVRMHCNAVFPQLRPAGRGTKKAATRAALATGNEYTPKRAPARAGARCGTQKGLKTFPGTCRGGYNRCAQKPIPARRQRRKVEITRRGSIGSRALPVRCQTPRRCKTYSGRVTTKR